MGEPNEVQDVNTSEQKAETSEQTETFTREQFDEGTRKAKSDALSELGRAKKLNEGLIKSSQAIQERLDRKEREDDERELEANQGNAPALSAIKERTARRKLESELATTERELGEEKAKTAEVTESEVKHTKERNAREVATRLGVDAKILQKHCDTVEAMEELAKSLPQKGEAKALKVDSGKTSGIQMPETSTAKMKIGWDKIHPK